MVESGLINEDSSKRRLIHDVGFDQHFKADTWEEYNRQFFDQLAPKYDFLNKIVSFGCHDGFKKKSIERIPVFPGARVLDLCTGSGDVAIALALKHPGLKIHAVDASEKMLEVARQKAQSAGVSDRIVFKQGDVMRLDYPDSYFDVTVISFGLRNLIDIPKAVGEFYRVTRRGGVFVNVDLGKPSGAFRRWLYKFYFGTLMPFLGRHVFHRGEFNSFQYLPSSNEYFPSPGGLVQLYVDAGFEHPRIYDYMLGGVSQQIVWKV